MQGRPHPPAERAELGLKPGSHLTASANYWYSHLQELQSSFASEIFPTLFPNTLLPQLPPRPSRASNSASAWRPSGTWQQPGGARPPGLNS